jgi:hypothetical protein
VDGIAAWVRKREGTGPASPQLLAFLSDGWTGRVPVRPNTPVAELKPLAARLAIRHGWDEAHAVAFILADTPPPTTIRLTQQERSHYPRAGTITLTISPFVTPAEVARAYRRARAQRLEGDIPKALSGHHAELGAFVAEVNDGRSWIEAMAAWNKAHPERTYDSDRAFNRDGRAAFERLTGQPLEWRRPAGRPRKEN